MVPTFTTFIACLKLIFHFLGTCLEFADRVIWLDKTGHISNEDTVTKSTSSPQSSPSQSSADEGNLSRAPNTDFTAGTSPAANLIEALNAKQRKGDWRVFQYYSLRMGTTGMLIFLSIMTVFIFLYGFPRKPLNFLLHSY